MTFLLINFTAKNASWHSPKPLDTFRKLTAGLRDVLLPSFTRLHRQIIAGLGVARLMRICR
jgi:hypothetical protein